MNFVVNNVEITIHTTDGSFTYNNDNVVSYEKRLAIGAPKFLALLTLTALPSTVESCRREYRSKSVSPAQLFWATFRVRHPVSIVVNVRRHCGEGVFPSPILLYISVFFLVFSFCKNQINCCQM